MIPPDLAALPIGTILLHDKRLHVNGCRCDGTAGPSQGGPARTMEAEECARRAILRAKKAGAS